MGVSNSVFWFFLNVVQIVFVQVCFRSGGTYVCLIIQIFVVNQKGRIVSPQIVWVIHSVGRLTNYHWRFFCFAAFICTFCLTYATFIVLSLALFRYERTMLRQLNYSSCYLFCTLFHTCIENWLLSGSYVVRLIVFSWALLRFESSYLGKLGICSSMYSSRLLFKSPKFFFNSSVRAAANYTYQKN